MNFQDTLKFAYNRGHYLSNESTWNVQPKDLALLKDGDKESVLILESFSKMFNTEYAPACAQQHCRSPYYDGKFGPAYQQCMKQLQSSYICGCPDVEPPQNAPLYSDRLRETYSNISEATGAGNWRGCHGIGDFHACVIDVFDSGIGSHLRPVFLDVLRAVQKKDAAHGLWNYFRDPSTKKDLLTDEDLGDLRRNIHFSFVSQSSGWIGLAQVIRNSGCNWEEWCRYLATYRPSNIINEWSTLISHEIGHNKAYGHTSGSSNTMNPVIIRGLPVDYYSERDAIYRLVQRDFGGQPVMKDDTKTLRIGGGKVILDLGSIPFDGNFDLFRGGDKLGGLLIQDNLFRIDVPDGIEGEFLVKKGLDIDFF